MSREKLTGKEIIASFLVTAKEERYRGRWIPADQWVTLIKSHFQYDLRYTALESSQLNAAIGNDQTPAAAMDNLRSKNRWGAFRNRHRRRVDGKSKKVVCYQFVNEDEELQEVSGTDIWWEGIKNRQPVTRSADVAAAAGLPARRSRNCQVLPGADSAKRDRSPQPSTNAKADTPRRGEKKKQSKIAGAILKESYFEQTEARKFLAPSSPTDESVLDAVNARIKVLFEANNKLDGWRMLIEGGDPDNTLTGTKIECAKERARFILAALIHVKDRMNRPKNRWTFLMCCQAAVKDLNRLGMVLTTNPEVLRRWHHSFAHNGNTFRIAPTAKRNLPIFFEKDPEASLQFCEYADTHLDRLSVNIMYEFCHLTLIPERLKLYNDARDDDQPELSKGEYLASFGLKKLTTETLREWMNQLGYKYSVRKKGYYNDKHEEPSNILYRKHFIERYKEYEFRSHRWIQLTRTESDKYVEDEQVLKEDGYEYVDRDDNNMVEYHVDSSDAFHEKMIDNVFGGNLSVRFPTNEAGERIGKPLFIFGQDECIFKQYIFHRMHWVGRDGERPLVPKDEGMGVMLSVFQSREFGFGMPLTEAQLTIINNYRLNKKYTDEAAASLLRGKPDKEPLKDSPFYRELEYGAALDGYWTYEHMSLQLEDCCDVLRALYGYDYDLAFLFDHSCGHDRKRADGLDFRAMRKEYKGIQPKMRESVILREEGFLGPFQHDNKLKVGDTQQMVFKQDDAGPFWLSPDERERMRLDAVIGEPVTKDKNRDDLISDLKAINVKVARGAKKPRLVELARLNSIPTAKTIQNVKEGWAGKPKGMQQTLWERGFIDPTKAVNFYTVEGPHHDNYGKPIKERSLKYLVSQLYDFAHEDSQLQFVGKELGLIVDRTPKCHPEMAGEGIEYSWGCAKNHYRNLPIAKKRSKALFLEHVRKCVSQNEITKAMVRLFSRRARRYMVAYYKLTHSLVEGDEFVDTSATPVKVEKIIKACKTHCCAMDFDAKFIAQHSP